MLKYRVLSRSIGIEVLELAVLMVPWSRGIGIDWYCPVFGYWDSGLDKHRYRIEVSIPKTILLKSSLTTCYAQHSDFQNNYSRNIV